MFYFNDLGKKKLVLDITEEELKQKSAFLELLDVVKQIIQSYLPLQICSENRIGTLEQIQGSVEVLERQIEKSERDLRR